MELLAIIVAMIAVAIVALRVGADSREYPVGGNLPPGSQGFGWNGDAGTTDN
jgi:hypothetical protein